MAVLSRVWDTMNSEMESHRQNYLEATTRVLDSDYYPSRPYLIQIMTSSLSFGYLALENDRWLTRHNPGENSPEFSGVSFADVSKCVRSMIDLGRWKVCTLSIADRMGEMVPMLTTGIPVVGPSLNWERLRGRPREGFNAELAELITEIEREDWGIDLSQTV